jgi:CBS domain-containing protein
MEDGQVLGLVTKFDFLRTFAFTSRQMVPHYDDLMSRRVADVMTEAIVHVDPTLPLTRVLQPSKYLRRYSWSSPNATNRLLILDCTERDFRCLVEPLASTEFGPTWKRG